MILTHTLPFLFILFIIFTIGRYYERTKNKDFKVNQDMYRLLNTTGIALDKMVSACGHSENQRVYLSMVAKPNAEKVLKRLDEALPILKESI